MTRQPPAVRFQADNSNDCWHFDLSPSDLKHIAQPVRGQLDPTRTKELTDQMLMAGLPI